MNGSSISASVAALRAAKAMTDGMTSDYSLDSIRSGILSKADEEAITDSHLSSLIQNFQNVLSKKSGPDDVVTSSQAFEVYGEIRVYRHLKHHGLKPECVPTVHGQGRPDFKCITPDGKPFYVEVKSFDVVEGEFAQTAMLEDGLNASIEIEAQQQRGDRIASSVRTLAPFGPMAHNESQVKRVINTITKKVSGNFKTSQFKQGPTFAMAVMDKLIIPGRQCALSPYYHHEICQGSACLSGALWASAYAQPGYLLLDHYEFEGKPTNSGSWTREGYFSKTSAHPAQGIILLDQSLSNPLIYGLTNSYSQTFTDWDERDTEHVLGIVCDAWNCESNAYGYSLAHYDSRIDYPEGEVSKSAWDDNPSP